MLVKANHLNYEYIFQYLLMPTAVCSMPLALKLLLTELKPPHLLRAVSP